MSDQRMRKGRPLEDDKPATLEKKAAITLGDSFGVLIRRRPLKLDQIAPRITEIQRKAKAATADLPHLARDGDAMRLQMIQNGILVTAMPSECDMMDVFAAVRGWRGIGRPRIVRISKANKDRPKPHMGHRDFGVIITRTAAQKRLIPVLCRSQIFDPDDDMINP